jgi:hypothetical protein
MSAWVIASIQMTMSRNLEVDKLYFNDSGSAEIGGYRGFM